MAAEKSMGTTLTLDPDGTATLIADLNSIGEIGIESSEIDTTTLDSADGYKEFIASLKDAGELSFKGILKSETNFEDMNDLADAQTVSDWLITYLSGSTLAFSGFVKKFMKTEDTIDSVRGFIGSIRVSGKPVYTPAEISA